MARVEEAREGYARSKDVESYFKGSHLKIFSTMSPTSVSRLGVRGFQNVHAQTVPPTKPAPMMAESKIAS
jgi:hypothetical protein